MARIIDLPARTGALAYDEDAVQDIVESLDEAQSGQGVVVDDAQDTEAKARTRARLMRAELAKLGIKVKSHAIKVDEDEFVPAVSIPKGDQS